MSNSFKLIADTIDNIFDDDVLNDLTDSLLDEIDLNELENFPDTGSLFSYLDDKPDDTVEETSFEKLCSRDKSEHTTLEALLRSKAPSCIAPAPDLRINTNGIIKEEFPVRMNSLLQKQCFATKPLQQQQQQQHSLQHHNRRTSLPLLVPSSANRSPVALKVSLPHLH